MFVRNSGNCVLCLIINQMGLEISICVATMELLQPFQFSGATKFSLLNLFSWSQT